MKSLVVGMGDLLQRSAGPTVIIDTLFPLTLRNILIDSNQLELALLNLVMNGRDAMAKGGHISIAARNETIKQSPHATGLPVGHYVSLAVTDEGAGMDEITLAKAIEPFFTTKGVGKGTGLGLSMVHGLAEQSGGRLIMRSELSRGTTAELWLPVATGPSQAPVVDEDVRLPAAECLRPLIILLVDDDPLIAMTMNAVLSDIGHQIIEVHAADEALVELSARKDIDLLITDYAMPGTNGLQLAEAARESCPSLPIILASGYAELPTRATVDVVRLSKPFGRRELVEAVEGMAICPAA